MLAALALLAACRFAIILTAPPDLTVNNEERLAAYVLDVLEGGSLVAPRDHTGRLMTKPPLLAWLAAGSTWLLGGVSRAALYLPSALATVGAAWLIFLAGRAFLGRDAGALGALMYLLSQAADDQLATARYDGLFAFTIALAAIAAFRASIGAAGWTPFWVAAATATMSKGPLGVVLAAGGLAAMAWDRSSGDRPPRLGGHGTGLALYAAVVGGWLALAFAVHGRELVDALLVGELVGHAVGRPGAAPSWQRFWKPALDVTTRFMPWIALTVMAMWRVVRSPAAEPTARRFERFLVAWFWVGLLIFTAAGHHRQRLILPLVVPAALLAGREAARWLRAWPARRTLAVAGAVTAVWLIGAAVDAHVIKRDRRGVRHTAAMREAARAARAALGPGVPLTHAGSPFAFRYYLGDLRPIASVGEAARLLARASPAFVAVPMAPWPPAPTTPAVWRWPAAGKPDVVVLANRPADERGGRIAFAVGAFAVDVAGADVAAVRGREVAIRARGPWSVAVENRSPRAERFAVRRVDTGERWPLALAPGEARRLP